MILASKTKKTLLWFAILLTLLVLFVGYIRYRSNYPTTDDAYVDANVVSMAAQVSGPVSDVYVHDNQYVKKGDILFSIDKKPYEVALEKAAAELQLANQNEGVDSDGIQIASANLLKAQAEQYLAQQHFDRINILVKKNIASEAQGDEAKSQLAYSNATVVEAQNKLTQAQNKRGEAGAANADIERAQANYDKTALDLAHTNIVAPENGYVTNFTLRSGSMVSAEVPLFQFVESTEWWITANFKETQMKRIKPGQKAKITIDLYPGKTYEGTVESLSYGSGAAFSLLPPENASGNWVKVTQRFPLKIVINNDDPNTPLRVGASSQVTIDTKTNVNKDT